MPELLVELFSEEIPARMQARAAEDIKKLITDKMVDSGLTYEAAKAFVTPRRLTLVVDGVPTRTPDLLEERKGPKVGAPEKALEGFMRAAGLAKIEDAEIQSDPKKGDFYVAKIEKKGRVAQEIIQEAVAQAVLEFPWPKSMRWGANSIRWVRPLHNILCTFGVEGEEPDIIPIDVNGVASEAKTWGHRFLAPDEISVKRFEDYQAALEKAYVILDADRRADIILNDAKQLAFAQGLELVEDEGLLREVAGLVEWPVVLMGRFDEDFLQVPEEVIITSLKSHQKCFCLKDASSGKLSNAFILVSNLKASDDGIEIVAGNQRVIRARLSDARFFWDTDQANTLSSRLPQLDNIVFHQKLGSQGDRVRRIMNLAKQLAPMVGADEALASRAAELAKADLLTEMVGEFPELQGLMGRYYADIEGEDATVCEALQLHYRPLGPSEMPPENPVSIAVALADKIDILTGFWSIDEKPTGSKDPFALRRAALGVVRILVENKIPLDLGHILTSSGLGQDVIEDLKGFIVDRLSVYLKGSGQRHDHVRAVLGREAAFDLYQISSDVKALGAILTTDDGVNLVAGLKRAGNILAAAEKSQGSDITTDVSDAILSEDAEISLFSQIGQAEIAIDTAFGQGNYQEALKALSDLRSDIDLFFVNVMVNDDDQNVRDNRLKLLSKLRSVANRLADFSRLEG